jgi:hypothetical protein
MKRAGKPALFDLQLNNDYFDAAGAAADAEASAFFALAFLAFLAFGAEASAEAAAGAEAGASAANAETANKPVIKAAISFFIFLSLGKLLKDS